MEVRRPIGGVAAPWTGAGVAASQQRFIPGSTGNSGFSGEKFVHTIRSRGRRFWRHPLRRQSATDLSMGIQSAENHFQHYPRSRNEDPDLGQEEDQLKCE